MLPCLGLALMMGCGGNNSVAPVTRPIITWANPAPVVYGTALGVAQLDATSNVAGQFVYIPSLGTVLGAGPQTLTATFIPEDDTDYTSATATVVLNISQAVPVLTWSVPAPIAYGTALSGVQLDATANVPGTLTYTPALGAVLDSGAQTLDVSFIPTDAKDYGTASARVTLQVNQAIPVLTWPQPTAIAVGMALGTQQLDAVASVPGSTSALAGSFLYLPGSGASFTSAGPQTLQVTFTPADLINYATAEANVTLTVLPFGVVAWGDSLTYGDEGSIDKGVHTNKLAKLIVLPVVNGGVGGQTSANIGVREGGVPTYASISGGVVPGSGSVSVAFPVGYEPVTDETRRVEGTILGVHGTVTLQSGVYIFTVTTPGDPVNAPGAPRFIVDTPYASYLPVFWEGRNNFTNAAQVLANIAAQVNTVPSTQDFLILSIPNSNTQADWEGGALYDKIITLNNALASTYGSHYLDIRKVLVESYDPSLATDVSDYTHDEPPTSLRAIFAEGTLANAVGPADTTMTLNVTSGALTKNSILTIDTGDAAENIQIVSVAVDTVTVVRGFGGLATAHDAGVPITDSDPDHLNADGAQVVANAVARYLSVYDVP